MFGFAPPSKKDINSLNTLMLNIINRDISLREGVRIHLFSVHLNYQSPGHKIEEHEHATFEMSIPLSGGMFTWVEGEKVENNADEPSIFLLPPGIFHHRTFFETAETVNISWVFAIEFEKKNSKIPLMMNNYAKKACQKRHFKIPVSPLFNELLKMFFSRFYSGGAGLPALAAELFKTMLVVIIHEELPEFFNAASEFTKEDTIHMDREKMIKKACLFVLSNNDICHDLAADMGISVRHLNRIFYEKNKMSIKQYRNNLRFNYACELLSSTDMKVSEIGSLIGFDNPVSFNAFFKKHSGLSPRRLRESRVLNNKKFQ